MLANLALPPPSGIPIGGAYYEQPAFQHRLFDHDCGRDGWLEFSDWLAHRQIVNVADGLVQISDELRNLRYGAADHDPKCKIYFQRDPHRASPR